MTADTKSVTHALRQRATIPALCQRLGFSKYRSSQVHHCRRPPPGKVSAIRGWSASSSSTVRTSLCCCFRSLLVVQLVLVLQLGCAPPLLDVPLWVVFPEPSTQIVSWPVVLRHSS